MKCLWRKNEGRRAVRVYCNNLSIRQERGDLATASGSNTLWNFKESLNWRQSRVQALCLFGKQSVNHYRPLEGCDHDRGSSLCYKSIPELRLSRSHQQTAFLVPVSDQHRSYHLAIIKLPLMLSAPISSLLRLMWNCSSRTLGRIFSLVQRLASWLQPKLDLFDIHFDFFTLG